MMLKRIIFYILLSLLPIEFIVAQKLTATMDSSYIELGRSTAVHLDFVQPQGKKYTYKNELDANSGIELVKATIPDTIQEGMYIRVKQDFLITSFDSGSHIVPAFKFIEETTSEVVESNELELEVKVLLEPDDNPDLIKDIKEIKELLTSLWSIIKVILIVLAVTALLAYLGFLGYVAWKKGKKSEHLVIVKKKILQPHEIALNALEDVKAKKLWKEENREKEYYTQITDILREYISKRFDIPAMEMTSYAIIDSLNYNLEAKGIVNELNMVLERADLVKFAKQKSSVADCEASLIKAFFIVQNTIKAEPEETELEVQNPSQEVKTSDFTNQITENGSI